MKLSTVAEDKEFGVSVHHPSSGNFIVEIYKYFEKIIIHSCYFNLLFHDLRNYLLITFSYDRDGIPSDVF